MSLFDETKACDVAAFFLSKSGGHMSMIKLMKLMYLAERESLNELHFPLLGDNLVSMNNGPVLSKTYDLMKRKVNHLTWCEKISIKDAAHNIKLLKPIREMDDLLELSRNEIKLLNKIWEKFGHFSHSSLIEYTHGSHCPEWRHPNGSTLPIRYEDILKSFKLDRDTIKDIINSIAEEEKLRAC